MSLTLKLCARKYKIRNTQVVIRVLATTRYLPLLPVLHSLRILISIRLYVFSLYE